MSSGLENPATAGVVPGVEARPSDRRATLAVLVPAAVLAIALHVWAIMSPAAPVNSDEAMTGLQAYNALHGHLAAVVEGNDYGGSLDVYLTAPLLLLGGGTLPIKVLPVLLSILSGLALAWATRPLLGRRVALIVGAVSWVSSGAAVVLWSLNYMGYASGATAMVLALGCAVRLMTVQRTDLAFWGGLAGGIALWGHPMFGLVVALAFFPAVIALRARPIATGALAVGALLGTAPWLVYLAGTGLPAVPQTGRTSGYLERIVIFMTELIPSGLGLRSPTGTWIGPPAPLQIGSVLVLLLALGGLGALLLSRRESALPFLVAGLGAFPVLAVFQAMAFTTDGRYAVAFMPQLLVGLAGWTTLRPSWSRPPLAVAVALPLVWALAACVPSLSSSAGWDLENANADTEYAVAALRASGITAVRGDYWAVYVLDYYAHGELDAWPDTVPRLADDVIRAKATPEAQVAFAYSADVAAVGSANLPHPLGSYRHLSRGRWELWIPTAAP